MSTQIRPGLDHLIRIGFAFDPEKFVVENRPLGQYGVGTRLPQGVPRERVMLLFEQNYVGLTPEAQKEYDEISESWTRKMTAKSEANAAGKPGEPVPLQSHERKSVKKTHGVR